MKVHKKTKIILLLCVSVLFVAGCSDNDNVNTPDSLVGTTLKATYSFVEYNIITFETDTTLLRVLKEFNNDIDSHYFKYSYNKPNVMIYDKHYTDTGVVSGNKITFTFKYEYDDEPFPPTIVFIKQ